MKCKLCNRRICRQSKTPNDRIDICARCHRDKLTSEQCLFNCRVCNSEGTTNKYRVYISSRRGGLMCRKCVDKQAGETWRKYHSSLTPAQRRANGKYGRSHQKTVNVNKQWETIKSNPEAYAKKKAKLKQQAIDYWANVSDEDKTEHMRKWLGPKSRSIVCDQMKSKMVECGLEGFKSEEGVHGFFPDEINYDLKIIVEMYGDVYHCNPKRYKDPNVFLKHIGRTVGEQWKRDRIRLACFYKHGYTVVVIWESDFRSNPIKEIERIKHEVEVKKNPDKQV